MGDNCFSSQQDDVVVSFDKINELMNEKQQTARAEVEKEEAAKEPEEKTQEEPPAAGDDEPKKARRGRPPKEGKAEPAGKEAAKPRRGRPPKADKAAPSEATPTKRDNLSQSGARQEGGTAEGAAFFRFPTGHGKLCRLLFFVLLRW